MELIYLGIQKKKQVCKKIIVKYRYKFAKERYYHIVAQIISKFHFGKIKLQCIWF